MQTTHFAQLIGEQAKRYQAKPALRYQLPEDSSWKELSWNQFEKLTRKMECALAAAGIQEHDTIATYTQNRSEGFIIDFAAYANRAVMVPLYATSSTAQIIYILKEAEVKLLFVGEQFQYDNAREALKELPDLKQIVALDPAIQLDPADTTTLYFDQFIELDSSEEQRNTVEARRAKAVPEDLANIIYTSGTTGEPKGVMLIHENFLEAMRIHDIRLTMLSEKDISLSFLPLTHIFERAWSYFCLWKGMRIDINTDPKNIQAVIRQVRPSVMCSVPRFWEKVYTAVQEKLASAKGLQKALIAQALRTGKKRNLDYVRIGKRVPLFTEIKYRFFEKTIFSKLKRAVGIENGVLFPVAGAPLSDTINEFMHACGINVTYGYGLSETTATVSCFDTHYKIGTVGTVMPDVQVKIGKENEILVKGKTVMHGYYKKPEETAKVFTKEGWLRTGDAGNLDQEGSIVITERIKDLFKTSNGKYIAPQAIETKVGEDKYIEQIAVIGDQRKYVTAIIIPAYEAIKEYALQKKISYQNLEELLKSHDIQRLFQDRINELQKNFAKFEQIKKFTLLPKSFSMEAGELTNTLKIRRAIINQRYRNEIEAMYA